MWIVACDDDSKFTCRLSELLPTVIAADDHISFYNGGMELLSAARKSQNPIDVLLLDMEMPGLSGLETARELRSFSTGTTIIVLTGYTKYALSCYDIRAFHYLTKPLEAERLKSVIDEARGSIVPREYMRISTRDADSFVPYGDVIYIESLNRSLYVHTRANGYKSGRTISDADKEVEEKGFYRIHKSFIVNMQHVECIHKSEKIVLLSDGMRLPIGDRKLAGFASALLRYKTARYG